MSRVSRLARAAGRLAGARVGASGSIVPRAALTEGVALAPRRAMSAAAAKEAAASPVTMEKTSDGIAVITINDPKERVSAPK